MSRTVKRARVELSPEDDMKLPNLTSSGTGNVLSTDAAANSNTDTHIPTAMDISDTDFANIIPELRHKSPSPPQSVPVQLLWSNVRGFAVPKYGPSILSPTPSTISSQQIDMILELLPAYAKLQDAYRAWVKLTNSQKRHLRTKFDLVKDRSSNLGISAFNWTSYNNNNQQEQDARLFSLFINITSAFAMWAHAQCFRGACGFTPESQFESTIFEDQLKLDFRDEIYNISVLLLNYISQIRNSNSNFNSGASGSTFEEVPPLEYYEHIN